MRKFVFFMIAVGLLAVCQPSNANELAQKVAELEAKVAKLTQVQTEIAQKTGLGALVRPEQLAFADGHQLGKKDAKVAILEFTDLQCPFCAKFHREVWPQIKKNYVDTGKVLFVGREFPIYKSHPQAPFAALTLRCAATQSVYAEMKDYLFAQKSGFEQTAIDLELKRLKADPKKHAECLADSKQQDIIRDSVLYAGKLGLNSTPTFFVGLNTGSHVNSYSELVGAKSYEEFAKAIDVLLAK